jgi:hypothetical protein
MHLTLATYLLALAAGSASPAPSIPDDARLAPVRPRLEQLVEKTAAAGLPADVVVSKVREGLAKGVDPARIEAAATRLAESLEVARRFAAERRPGASPSAAMVRALAHAKMAGLELDATDSVVRGATGDAPTARAVEVLADLARRGYPSARSSHVVRDVLTRDPAALERLPAALETIRTEQALTHVEAVDALSRGISGSDSLQAAYTRTVDEERRNRAPGGGAGKPRKDNGEPQGGAGPGKSDFAPGHLKEGKMQKPRGRKEK